MTGTLTRSRALMDADNLLMLVLIGQFLLILLLLFLLLSSFCRLRCCVILMGTAACLWPGGLVFYSSARQVFSVISVERHVTFA